MVIFSCKAITKHGKRVNRCTWVFNDRFVPSAKITNEGIYSIISDYLGTPVEAYGEQGNRVWSAELDIYGRVNEFTGEKDFIPFRYQGQYEEVEIGFYYNRFRYYDPEQGNYTQIDPIGLAGGNPTLYGYVRNTNNSFDPFGLWS
ncbi:RHS repeat domain-containing protein [Lysinibacillus sp. TE18511]